MRSLYLSILLLSPALLVSAESQPLVVQPDTPWWATAILTLITLVVAPFLTKYLKDASETRRAELANQELTKKERILQTLKAYALERAAAYAERDLPHISRLVVMGELKTSLQIKETLRELGAKLKEDLVIFARDNFGQDLIKEYGNKYVSEIIEWAANKVSPFPGRETAVALLEGGAQRLLDNGVDRAFMAISSRVED